MNLVAFISQAPGPARSTGDMVFDVDPSIAILEQAKLSRGGGRVGDSPEPGLII